MEQKNTIDDSENDIIETEPSMLPVPMNAAERSIQVSASKNSFDLLNEGISDTMNYADNCMSELISQMEQVRNCDESRANEKMQNMSLAARSIAEVMREKVEAMKLLRVLSRNGK